MHRVYNLFIFAKSVCKIDPQESLLITCIKTTGAQGSENELSATLYKI